MTTASRPAPPDRSSEIEQLRNCDIVMKGGITSGVVYPPAIREIAAAFRFRNIGGTSAGAIAACATAAAEYRRMTGGGRAGFERFARVPAELGKDHRLLKLFSPIPATKPIFDAVVAAVTAKSPLQRCWVAVRLMSGPLRIGALTGSVPGVLLAIAALAVQPNVWALPAILAAAGVALGGALVGAAVHGIRYTSDTLATTFFGLCIGVTDSTDPHEGAIGPWLTGLIDEIAGTPSCEPLTFGHLWYGPTRRPEPPAIVDASTAERGSHDLGVRPADPAINLEMVTTCLSQGRPLTFPTDETVFAFDPAEMRRFFPENVVDWMIAHRTRANLPEPLIGLPASVDLPIVVAARMSLAFPFLLSALKLYELTDPSAQASRAAWSECWFTDGGLTSNFPIALFDSPLPRWPTFAMNLGEFSAERKPSADESQNVWMPQSDCDEPMASPAVPSFVAFLGAMVGAVKDWNDNTQARLPGFRDRIVTVMLRPREGGLNLDMDAALIERLVARGAAAGRLLVKRFDQASCGRVTDAMDWEKHRWVRYRSTAASMQTYFRILNKKYNDPQPGDLAYKDFIAVAKAKATIYPLTDLTAAAEPQLTEGVTDVAARWETTHVDFAAGAPVPHPDLVHRLRI